MRRRALLAASQTGGGNDGPVTFSIQDADGLVTEYTIPYQMTWEEFINSDSNETKFDVKGRYYKQFLLRDDIPAYAFLYEGAYDLELWILDPELGLYVAKNQHVESKLYIAN